MRKGMMSAVVFRYLSLAINFLIALLVSRHMGSEAKGEVTLLLTSITIVQFICGFAGGQGLLFLIGGKEPQRLLLPVLGFSVVVCAAASLLLYVFPGLFQQYAVVIGICALLAVMYSLQQTHRLSAGRVVQHSLFSILPALLQLMVLALLMFVMNLQTVNAFVLSLYVAGTLAIIISSVQSFSDFAAQSFVWQWSNLRESLRANFGFQMAEMLQLLNLRFYFYLLLFFNGSKTLGIYSVGISVLESVWVIARALSLVRYSQIANRQETEPWRLQLRVLRMAVVVSGLLLLVFAMLPRDFYVVVFGKQFAHVKYSTRFLFPGMLFYVVVIVLESFYLGLGNYKLLIRSQLIGFISMLVLSAFFIPRFRMSGAGLVASVTYFIIAAQLLFHFVSANRIHWREWWRWR